MYTCTCIDEKIGWIIVQDTDTYPPSHTILFILFWHEHYPHDIKLLYEMTMKERCSFQIRLDYVKNGK